MDSFLSKASSFMSEQGDKDGEHRKPASSGGYGDLLAGAQSLMQGATKPASAEEATHKPPSSTDENKKYGDLLAGAQSLTGAAKPKPKGGEDDAINVALDKKEEDALKPARSGGYGDVLASTQVLMKAAKVSGEADMGEVAGAAANLLGAAAKYGELEKRGYGEYVNKADTYLHDYQVSHSKPGANPSGGNESSPHKSPSSRGDDDDAKE